MSIDLVHMHSLLSLPSSSSAEMTVHLFDCVIHGLGRGGEVFSLPF